MTPPTPTRHLAAIAAMAENRVIGRDGQLPWRLRDDLLHFKRTTMGRVMILGRATFDESGKPLPGRTSIVLTRNPAWAHPGVHVAHDPDSALELANRLTVEQSGEPALTDPDRCPVVIGGGHVYQQFLPQITVLDLTIVHAEVAGDAHFPELDPNAWVETQRSELAADDRNDFPCTIKRLMRVGF